MAEQVYVFRAKLKEWRGVRRTIAMRCDETLGDPATEGLQGQWSEYSPSGERCSGLAGLAVQAGVPQWNGPTVATWTFTRCNLRSR